MKFQSDNPLEIFVGRSQLETRVGELSKEIAQNLDDSKKKKPLLISPSYGGNVFAANLSATLRKPHTLEIVNLVPYAKSKKSGFLRISHSFSPLNNITDRDIILVDGIIDTGMTLKCLFDNLVCHKPRSLTVCVLFDRPDSRLVNVPISLKGFVAPKLPLVGYGLEHRSRYANLPDVHILSSTKRAALSNAA